MFVHRHSDGKEQFDRVMGAVRAAPELVALGKDGRGEERFTSRAMIETEQRLERATERDGERDRHGRQRTGSRAARLAPPSGAACVLVGRAAHAFEHVTDASDLGVVVGYAGTGKSAMLGVARAAVGERRLSRPAALALSGIAAENLESGSGHRVAHDREPRASMVARSRVARPEQTCW